MFKELARQGKQISDDLVVKLLQQGEYGVLSTIGPNGYPYGVPLSYAYVDKAIYFHCAIAGHKLDNIAYNQSASFCVVNKAVTLPNKFTVSYESVILYGKASEVIDTDEKYQALLALVEKYASDYIESGKKYIKNDMHKTKVIKIEIEKVIGKKSN